ncbi:MAG TPA: phosphoribosyltransferase [Acidimicrobiales bacterium]|nr:phosphoribosyltransferase [Acidimicrobiales bacterium]
MQPSPSHPPREVLTYERFGEAARELTTTIVESGYEPDWIVCIARGGLIVGGAIGYALPLKNIATLNVEFYTDVDERLEVPVVLPPVLDLVDLAHTKVLVVDDVADTGETLKLVVEMLRPSVEEVRSAVLYEKSRSVVKPDYSWRKTEAWIDFPWSTLPPIARPDLEPS